MTLGLKSVLLVARSYLVVAPYQDELFRVEHLKTEQIYYHFYTMLSSVHKVTQEDEFASLLGLA